MKNRSFPISLAVGWLFVLLAQPLAVRAEDAPKAASLYDEKADGAAQIAAALATARVEHKQVLLEFGANWCEWCRQLHALTESNDTIAAKLRSDYVVVLVDVDRDHNSDVDRKYGHPRGTGLPVLVVLDAAGKQLVFQKSAPLEEGDNPSPAKVQAFLEKWGPKAEVGR